jgi:hypothetical protein
MFRKLALLPSSGECRGKKEEPTLSKEPNRVGVLLFSPSIDLRMEAEPFSETL